MQVPAIHTSPALGVSMPAIRFSSVLLPLPLRPRIATTSPSGMATEVSRSTRRFRSPSSYSLLTRSSRTIGTGAMKQTRLGPTSSDPQTQPPGLWAHLLAERVTAHRQRDLHLREKRVWTDDWSDLLGVVKR